MSNVVYSTTTPYSIISNDFINKFIKSTNVTFNELENIDRKWRKLGKQAYNGKLTGMKY